MPSVLVTGAGRGLGLEFARQYAADGWSVIATVRNEGAARELRGLAGEIRIETLDMRDHSSLAALARRIEGPLDLLIANAGISGPDRLTTAADAAGWLEVFDVNVIAPTLLAQTLAPKVVAARGRLVAITSQMGSIADNRSGGWTAYRAAKAALNAAWRSLAVEMSAEPIAIAMLHPGWVKTDMGGAGATLEIPDSVAALRRVIDGLRPADKGVFLNYRGETLPW
jgi:NAD(P)-dependent dehydrogenase (short-subunit alcohol dehydrogenase family)